MIDSQEKLIITLNEYGSSKELNKLVDYKEKLKHLELYIGEIELEEEDGIFIGQCLQNLKNLHTLKLEIGANMIEEVGCYSIAKAIDEMNNLKNIDIFIDDFNDLNWKGLKQIVRSIKDKKDLEKQKLGKPMNKMVKQVEKEKIISHYLRVLRFRKAINLKISQYLPRY